MENSISDSEVKEAPELVVELEVDQENLVKMLKALTEAGVEFKIKLVEEKVEAPTLPLPPAITVTPFPFPIDPNIRYYVAPQPQTVGPIVSPYTTPGTATPQPSILPITISKADLSVPITSSTVVGYPPGTQISYTTN